MVCGLERADSDRLSCRHCGRPYEALEPYSSPHSNRYAFSEYAIHGLILCAWNIRRCCVLTLPTKSLRPIVVIATVGWDFAFAPVRPPRIARTHPPCDRARIHRTLTAHLACSNCSVLENFSTIFAISALDASRRSLMCLCFEITSQLGTVSISARSWPGSG
jgi:hypothetical protein